MALAPPPSPLSPSPADDAAHAGRVRRPERWFHAGITGKDAMQMLASERQYTFLVRESQRFPGQYAVSVKIGDESYKHIRIEQHPATRRVHVGAGDDFASIDDLLAHYKKNPMVEEGTQAVIRLTHLLRSTAVPVDALAERVEVLSRRDEFGKDGFLDEFERLNHTDSLMFSRRDGKLPQNASKNRYKNIVPYDHTRVRLRESPAGAGADYINANYILGCLSNTVGDFWRMVYQEKVAVIIMTTKERERGRIKCERYWPDKSKVLSADKEAFCIENQEEEVIREEHQASFVRRRLLLKWSDGQRIILHFQFVGWPDHGCPQNPEYVLRMLERAKAEADKQPLAPVVVHCSAGIGRTGTLIALDALLRYVCVHGSDSRIDVARTVLQMREQREGMVQTEQQYRFIYKALACYVNTRRILAATPPHTVPAAERQLSGGDCS